MLRYGAGRNLLKGNVRFDMGHAKWQSIWWAEISEPLMRKTVTWFESWPSQFVKLIRILTSVKLGSALKLISFFVIGSFKHARTRGNAVATTARVKLTRIPWYRDACKMTDCTEEYLQTVGQYYLQSPYGSVLDNRDSNVWVGGANTVSDGIRAG